MKKDYLAKNTPIKQGALIAVITLVTIILAVMLPWVLNMINPQPMPGTAQTGIFDAYLASDLNGEYRSTSFAPTQEIYLFFELNDPSGLNMVKTFWNTVDVSGYQPGTEIYRTEDKIKTSGFILHINKELWEPGKYKVELYLNDIPDETLEFEITN